MRRVAASARAVVLCAAPVFAAVAGLDTNGDSLASFEEMIAVYPDLTEEVFGEIDTSANSFADDAELTAAVAAEILPQAAQ